MNILLKMKQIKDLAPSERQVVDFILADPKRAADMGIVEIARQTYTSTSTVMRLSKKLGMEGFIEFRKQLAQDLNDYIESTLMFKRQEPLTPEDTVAAVVDKVTGNNVRAVLDVKRFNPLEVFERVVGMMYAARQIDFYGSGVSNLICHDAMIKALRLGVPSTAFSFYSEMAMLARTCPSTHLAIILSYTGQTEDTLRVAEYLKQGGVPSVSITSHTDNALLELCSVNLFVDSFESVYRVGGMSSRLSSLHLLDILFSLFMNKHGERLNEAIEKTFLAETFHHLGRKLDEE